MTGRQTSSYSVLFTMAAATVLTTGGVCVLIAVPSVLWLAVSYAVVLVTVVLVLGFIVHLMNQDT